ncbi:family 2A encapsulin nanocompartment cargo protein cysteine desulfurase [Sphingobacterium siyangense]|uniref:family 2A encapsulin nanocompartment cargo protein cysteine desulfurase n=1 Tax=Sphingobacterium siyangense TaxID=459529 RepID=UPI003C74E1FD
MSHLDIDFERFLTEEANRYFKAVPTENLLSGDLPRHEIHPEKLAPDPKRREFHLEDPAIGFHDPSFHRENATIPVAGNGRQPGIYNPVLPPTTGVDIEPQVNKLPFAETHENPLDTLRGTLQQLSGFTHTSQIPMADSANSFYFIKSGAAFENTSFLPYDTLKPRFDVQSIRRDFPILQETVRGRPLVWLDNAATTQKPQVVIDRISRFYQTENSNIHRAAHELAARATDAYEESRNVIKNFLNASSPNEIIFTRGTTESINLVANSWGDQHLGPDDEIIISYLEHHANIVPWQQLSQKKGFKIRVIPVDEQGNLLFDEYSKLLSSRTKLVSFTHVSNALGTITPAKAIIDSAHRVGAKVLLDGAQSVSHIAIDLQYLNPDFFVFSGHKIFGPTGIGVLYGKEDILNNTQPYQSGGNMIRDVSFEKTEFHAVPNRFEAGTGNIADAVGLGAAIRYVQAIGIDNIYHYEHDLLDYATRSLKQIAGVTLIGTATEKTSVLSFTLSGYSNNEVGQALNEVGIAVRTGHHCAQPILRRLGYESSVRPSLAFYNTHQEIDLLALTVERLVNRNKRFY